MRAGVSGMGYVSLIATGSQTHLLYQVLWGDVQDLEPLNVMGPGLWDSSRPLGKC